MSDPSRRSLWTCDVGGHLSGRRITVGLLATLASTLLTSGCSSVLSSEFLSFVDPSNPTDNGRVPGVTLDNARGHVAVLFINNTRYDPRLLNYLEDTGADLGDNPEQLVPLMRARFQVEYVNGTSTTIEFISGDRIVEGSDEEDVAVAAPPELNDLALKNEVLLCDVARIIPIQDQISIFVPVTIRTVRLMTTQNNIVPQITVRGGPQYVPLRSDEVDDNNNISVLRNYDIRDAPVPIQNVQCGSAVGFTVNGTLAVPFESTYLLNRPGYDETDLQSAAASPGRFEFFTQVR